MRQELLEAPMICLQSDDLALLQCCEPSYDSAQKAPRKSTFTVTNDEAESFGTNVEEMTLCCKGSFPGRFKFLLDWLLE